MLEKLRHKSSFLIAVALLFGFIFYVGWQMQSGQSMGGNRGFMRWIAEALNWFSDAIGPANAGYAIMAFAVFAGTFAIVWIWREPMI